MQQCLPASEALLTELVAYLAKNIKHSSIKIYLAAVRPSFSYSSRFSFKFAKDFSPPAGLAWYKEISRGQNSDLSTY